MEVALIVSLIVNLVLAVLVATLGLTIPFMMWKCFKLEQKIDQLDEVVVTMNGIIGTPTTLPPHTLEKAP